MLRRENNRQKLCSRSILSPRTGAEYVFLMRYTSLLALKKRFGLLESLVRDTAQIISPTILTAALRKH